MFRLKDGSIDYLIERSFRTKTLLLLIGGAFILVSRRTWNIHWLFGAGVFFTGLLWEWSILYILYIEISRMQTRIDQRKREIDEAQTGIEETRREVLERQREIEEIEERTFDNISDSRNSMNNLESRVNELEDIIDGRRGLEQRVENLEDQLDGFGSRIR